MVDVLDANLEEINMLSPWGERMLSLVDLIKRGTLPLEIAAYLIGRMKNGASILVGAIPNRAGKTTLMGALLGVIPSSDRIIVIENASMVSVLKPGTREMPKTYVIHEIARGGWGPGGWGRYLRVPDVVDVTLLVKRACANTRLATTIHAESIEEVKDDFRRFGFEGAINVFNIIIFLQYDPLNPPRIVDEVWEFDKQSQSHKQIYFHYSNAEGFSQDFYSDPISQRRKGSIIWKKFLSKCLSQDIYQIEKVAYTLKEYENALAS